MSNRPHNARMALSTLRFVRIELAALYRLWRNGQIDNKQLGAGTYCLNVLAGIIEAQTLDERLAHIESLLAEGTLPASIARARLCASEPWKAASIN